MTDISFDRTDRQGHHPSASKYVSNRRCFGRVANRCAGTVHLDKSQLVGDDARLRVHFAQQFGLRRLARQ